MLDALGQVVGDGVSGVTFAPARVAHRNLALAVRANSELSSAEAIPGFASGVES